MSVKVLKLQPVKPQFNSIITCLCLTWELTTSGAFSEHGNASASLTQPVWTHLLLWLSFYVHSRIFKWSSFLVTSAGWGHLAMLMEWVLRWEWSLCTMRTSQLISWLITLTFHADSPRPRSPSGWIASLSKISSLLSPPNLLAETLIILNTLSALHK